MKNAGEYNKRIVIARSLNEDADGFVNIKDPAQLIPVLNTWAKVKTTKGFTLYTSHTDFEKALTLFKIRKPPYVKIERGMFIRFKDRIYTIEYVDNVDEDDTELEIQAKAVTK